MRLQGASPLARGLYIHVPFCRTKCTYCGFSSQTDLAPMEAFIEGLGLEARLRLSGDMTFSTLYLGGGTPSVLPMGLLSRLIQGVVAPWALTPTAEVTVEVNPDDVTRALLEGLLSLGVNRLSLGAQSFFDDELGYLGRRHTASQAHQAIALARDAGFPAVGIDLMYGFRGQRFERWRRTMDEALRWRPEHLSCYGLALEPNTPLARRPPEEVRVAEGKEYDFFRCTSRILTDHGYEHYEVSNYALPGFRALHNTRYWHHAPYCGLGPSAHSFDGTTRSWNVRSLHQYLGHLNGGDLPLEGCEVLTDEQMAMEKAMLGLRTDRGVALSALLRWPEAERRIRLLEADGFIRHEEGRIVPTVAGMAVADRLALELVG